MAFPSIASVATTASLSGTSHTVNLPASIAAGDLLIMSAAVGGSAVLSWPAGWTEFANGTNGAARLALAYRIATGSEGSTAAATTDIAVTPNFFVHRITGWHGTAAPEAATAGATTATPDPPSVTPSWGTADTLWLVYCTKGGTSAPTSFPTNYSLNQNTLSSQSPAHSTAGRQLNSSLEDPGVFTFSGSSTSVAGTAAIRPLSTGFPFTPNPMLPLLVR